MAQYQARYNSLFKNDISNDEVNKLLPVVEVALDQVEVDGSHKDEELHGTITKLSHRDAIGIQPPSRSMLKPYVLFKGEIAQVDNGGLVRQVERTVSDNVEKFEGFTAQNHRGTKEKPTTGPKWFHMQRTNLTPELKRDLQILEMRSVLDPKHHYKNGISKPKPPKFSHVGTIIEGPTEFYNSRLLKCERRNTLMEDVLIGEAKSKSFTKRYREIQARKLSGKRSYYKLIQNTRLRKRT